MQRIIEILMTRDLMTRSDATQAVEEFIAWLNANMGELSLCDIEDQFQADFFLEPDYLDGILVSLC